MRKLLGLQQATSSRPATVAQSGLQTALSLAASVGLSAVVGLVIARNYGRGAETDGFFAAYGVFIVLVLAAHAFRVVALPALARAHGEQRLAAETLAWALALAVLALPSVAIALLASSHVAAALTGSLPPAAQETAADALVWMVPAATAQLYAALAASALAALDDYATAALGFALGSVAGLALILVLVAAGAGIVAVAWGMALNGAVSLLVPVGRLVSRRGVQSARARPPDVPARLAAFGRGVTIPIALQALYLVCLRLAAELGVGSVTSFTYAYLIASAFVAVTASSLALVSSVPLARVGLDGDRAARHVVNTSWLALAVVAGAAGFFALVGGRVVSGVLGAGYGGEIGDELGGLVVYLAPWMVASVGVSVTFPLLFVADRARRLPLLAAGAVGAHVGVAWVARELLSLRGIAFGLAFTTGVILAGLLLLLSRETLRAAARGLAGAALWSAALAATAFVPLALALPASLAAVVGLAVYGVLLFVVRPRGLRDAWAYVRTLA